MHIYIDSSRKRMKYGKKRKKSKKSRFWILKNVENVFSNAYIPLYGSLLELQIHTERTVF